MTGLGRTHAPLTVTGALATFAAIMEAAVTDRLIVRSLATAVKLPTKERWGTVPLTTGKVPNLAASIEPALGNAVIVAAQTGLRSGELFGVSETGSIGYAGSCASTGKCARAGDRTAGIRATEDESQRSDGPAFRCGITRRRH